MALAAALSRTAVNKCLDMLYEDPDRGLARAMDLADAFAGSAGRVQRARARRALEDEADPYYPLVRRLLEDVDPGQLRRVVDTLVSRAVVSGWKQGQAARRRLACPVPAVIEIQAVPAADGVQKRLTAAEIDGLIRSGKRLGVYVYIYSGGDSLRRQKNLLHLAQVHRDCLFLFASPGDRLTQEVAGRMRACANVVPVIDAAAVQAGALLRENRLCFGAYARREGDVTDKLDAALAMGAYFCWLTGAGPDPAARRAVTAYRSGHALAVVDFPDDCALVGGCIGGGRRLLTIDAYGRLLACPRQDASSPSLRDLSLPEALRALDRPGPCPFGQKPADV